MAFRRSSSDDDRADPGAADDRPDAPPAAPAAAPAGRRPDDRPDDRRIGIREDEPPAGRGGDLADVPRLPRGRGFKLSLGELLRIGMTAIMLIAVIVLAGPCSEAVGRFVASFDPPDAQPPAPPRVPAGYVHLTPDMSPAEVERAIAAARDGGAPPSDAAAAPAPPAGSAAPAATSAADAGAPVDAAADAPAAPAAPLGERHGTRSLPPSTERP